MAKAVLGELALALGQGESGHQVLAVDPTLVRCSNTIHMRTTGLSRDDGESNLHHSFKTAQGFAGEGG